MKNSIFTLSCATWSFLKKVKDVKKRWDLFEALIILALDGKIPDQIIYVLEKKKPLKYFEGYFLAKKFDSKTVLKNQNVLIFSASYQDVLKVKLSFPKSCYIFDLTRFL